MKERSIEKMESSEEEDDLPSIESITPQSKIDSVHQSLTEKVPPFSLSLATFSNFSSSSESIHSTLS